MTAGFPFSGRWLIRFDPLIHSRQEILTHLDRLIVETDLPFVGGAPLIRVRYEKTGINTWNLQDMHLDIRIGEIQSLEFSQKPIQMDPEWFCLPPVSLQRIRLSWLNPPRDLRWRTMGLPTSHLFLGMQLRACGFQVEVVPAVMEDLQPNFPSTFDLLGITLYEDLFSESIAWLQRLPLAPETWLAAGGPLVTLSPAAALYHFPQISLMIRGEGDVVLPSLLDALNRGDPDRLFLERGVALEKNGLMVFSAFDQVNHPLPETWIPDHPNLDFIPREFLEKDLELNFSRGCRRSCLFCSRPHGRIQRRLPQPAVTIFLDEYDRRLRQTTTVHDAASRTVNINDDDILQDPGFAADMLARLVERGFRIWGLQTSIQTLISRQGDIDREIIDLIADRRWYVGGNPLVWIGTDLFLTQRGRRLGKPTPPLASLGDLFTRFEEMQVDHFHYWISSDWKTDWPEFIEELNRIGGFMTGFSRFGLLPHAPFLIPYRSTPVYARLVNGKQDGRIRFRSLLNAPRESFRHPLVERLDTAWPLLNRLLANEPDPRGFGFFDYLKNRDFLRLWMTVHHFLKQERLQGQGLSAGTRSLLQGMETELADYISNLP